MSARHVAAALSGLLIGAMAAAAQAQVIGADLASVRGVYAQAQDVQIAGQPALELRDVDYAGFRWSTVDFVFDASGHLSRLQMTSRAATYDTILRVASAQLQASGPIRSMAAAERAGREMQIRVCEGDGGEVTLTYEALTQVS